MKQVILSLVKRMMFLFMWLFPLCLFAQNITVRGTVTDNNNEPLIGVTVQVQGTATGTITDMDGNFVLPDVPSSGILEISYVGMQRQTVPVDGRTFISVVLAEDTETLDELVVIGYGTVRKRDLTGAVTSVSNQEIVISPTNNVMEALAGKIPGMDIIKSSGRVGEGVDIILRGSRSIYGDNSPLFIIDGIPGSYSQVNPSDIESVDILKDASSTAIYGSAGANGVVIITTKRGKEGKTRVNLDSYFGFSGKPEFFHGMIGDEWVQYQREAYRYQNGQYPADMSTLLPDAGKLEAYNQGKWIDWVEEAAGNTATNHVTNLSITGGNAKTRVYSSISYNRDQGLLKNENQDRYVFRFNVDHELFNWMKTGITSNLSYSDRNNGVNNTFTRSLSAFPLGDAYDENGNIIHEYATNEFSPLGDFIPYQFENNNKNTYIHVTGNVEIVPVAGVSLKTVLSGTLNNGRTGQFWGNQANANRPTYAGSPHASITNNYGRSYTWENILSYNNTFADKHTVGATLVTSWSHSQNEFNMAASSGQQLESWSYWRLMSGTAPHVESGFDQTQKMSYAIRVNYSLLGKYLLTFSNRWDGVSWLSAGHKWDSFPAAAVAWRISDEEFMGSIDWLTNLKLRVGYGVTGNSGGIGAYGSTTNVYAYSSAGISIDGQIVPFTQYTGTYGNPSLGWEKSKNWNLGFDFGFSNRVNGTLDLFQTKTTGLLFRRTMPITDGITGWGAPLSSWENIAETSNRGFELAINSHNIETRDFRWNTDLTFTWSEEKIESLPSGDLIAESLFEGYPIRSLYNYKYLGIWGSDTPAETLEIYGVKPGWIRIETVENDGDGGEHKYSENDRQILGHLNPDYIVGLNNSFQYKDFDFTVFAMARYGQTIESDLIGWYTAKANTSTNQPRGIDYWTESNQSAYFPVPGSGDEQTVMSALRFRDGSFIKIKNITLGYSLPKSVIQKTFFENCRFYVTAYNPFVYVKDKQLRGTDPETNGSDSFPLYKQYVFGININF
ncbi:SusC/RagA family [Proteiniphilum saccharofermentans]|uniref:SusC/RagA family n=1 Tax=Proteiniphilum saccharofermentans TaxID=1642647 RepID=A0A1R3SZ81_9BACT|nr:TonB-dependent receptor [Proteiniphilum sp. X52]SCD21496.1 SusC/RagA family [Proteiniphilum saccharofermentans]